MNKLPGSTTDMKATANALLSELQAAWDENVARDRTNPLSNAVLLTALQLVDQLDTQKLHLSEVEAAVQSLSVEALRHRAGRSAQYLGTAGRAANEAAVRALAQKLIHRNGQALSFEAFARQLDTEGLGLVITAHPTFSLSEEMMGLLAQMIEKKEGADTDQALWRAPHRPNLEINLDYERKLAERSLKNAQAALEDFYDILLEEAAKTYGPQAWTLERQFCSLASWVGYDLDGRADIGWQKSLAFRYLSAAERSQELAEDWAAIAGLAENEAPTLRDKAKAVAADLKALAALYQDLYRQLPGEDADLQAVKMFSRHSVERNEERRRLDRAIHGGIDALLHGAADGKLKARIARFRGALKTHGYGHSRVHFRLNSAQLHNAIRPIVAMEHQPDSSSNRRRYLSAVSKILDDVKPVSINYGSLARERTTAKRLFMLIAQILKFVDDTTPIRLLIAESDTPFTVLSALFYAKLFNIDDKVEICPLFETDEGLERGARVMEELLSNPHYLAYVQKHGRLCVQTGFSDSGRYVGQPAATLGIERFRIKLAQLWRKFPLENVSLAIFDTHGESVGRGAHPGGFAARLDYLHSAKAREVFRAHGVAYCQEVSLQGGDGYIWLYTRDLAFATITRYMEKCFANRLETEAPEDSFYVDTDWSLDFFLSLREFQTQTVNDADYLPLIVNYGPNLLYPSGSRMTVRQTEGQLKSRPSHISQIRAIPHNAILQQMGYMGNSLGGVGNAILKDIDHFNAIYQSSPRCRQIIELVRYAHRYSDMRVLEGYLRLFDSDYWLHYAHAQQDRKRRMRFLRLYSQMERLGSPVSHAAVVRRFHHDMIQLHHALNGLADGVGVTEDQPLIFLHILRLALIQKLYLLASRVPRFASQPSLTIEDLISELLHLNVGPTVGLLRQIFPVEATQNESEEYGEPATYKGDMARGYVFENRVLFDQMESIYDLIRRISVAILNRIGAIG